jgi:hypothetical protein
MNSSMAITLKQNRGTSAAENLLGSSNSNAEERQI